MKKHWILPVVTVDKTSSKCLWLGFFSFPGCNYRLLSIQDSLLCDQTNLENEKIVSNRRHTKNSKNCAWILTIGEAKTNRWSIALWIPGLGYIMEICFKKQTTKSCKTKRKEDHCITIKDQLSFLKVIHTTAVEYIFSSTHWTSPQTDHILGYKTNIK